MIFDEQDAPAMGPGGTRIGGFEDESAALDRGQFEDIESEGERILRDEV